MSLQRLLKIPFRGWRGHLDKTKEIGGGKQGTKQMERKMSFTVSRTSSCAALTLYAVGLVQVETLRAGPAAITLRKPRLSFRGAHYEQTESPPGCPVLWRRPHSVPRQAPGASRGNSISLYARHSTVMGKLGASTSPLMRRKEDEPPLHGCKCQRSLEHHGVV